MSARDTREPIKELIKKHFEVFTERGLCKGTRGFEFNVDTGDTKPVCYKYPRYRKYETDIINSLLAKLKENRIAEPDRGSWGALIVLVEKGNKKMFPGSILFGGCACPFTSSTK